MGGQKQTEEGRGDFDKQELDDVLDDALDDSFPASDPPAITQPRKKKNPPSGSEPEVK